MTLPLTELSKGSISRHLIVWMVVNQVQDITLRPDLIITPLKHIAALIHEKTGYNLWQEENISSMIGMIPNKARPASGGRPSGPASAAGAARRSSPRRADRPETESARCRS